MAIAIAMLAALPGCEPPPLTDNGVVGAFGEMGLGPGQFSYPRAISIDSAGRVYVVDKSARIQRFSVEGKLEADWSMPERAAGKPVGIHAADDGRLFVADTHYHRVIVYDPDGRELNRFGREGTGDGEFQLPTDIALDASGRIYVSEYSGNDRITRWTPDFEFDRVICSREPIDGLPLNRPSAIDVDAKETLWVADACNHRILRLDLEGRLISAWGTMGREVGQLRYPYDLQCLPDGNILVCEFANSRLQWFAPDGKSLRTWGHEGRKLGDLWAPWGVDLGPDGRIYVLDSRNDRVQIIKL